MTRGTTLALALLCAAWSHNQATAQTAQTKVLRSRPRLLVTDAQLPALRKRCRGVAKPMFEEMRRRCDGMLRTPAKLDNNGRHYLPCYALLFLVTGEAKYASKAAEWGELLAAETIDNPWTCLEYIPTAAFAYDWIHETLTPKQRQHFADGLIRQVRRIKKLWRHSDYNNHFLLEHTSQLHVALALAHEPHDSQLQKTWLLESREWLLTHVIPAANEMAGSDPKTCGGQAEGFGYSNWGYARPLAMQLAAWKTATGQDLFSSCMALRFEGIWNIHGRRPDGHLFRSEDCASRLTWGQFDQARFFLEAREYRDGFAQTAAQSIARRYPQLNWMSLLFFDATLEARPFSDLPLARRFEPLGHVYTRSSWKADAFFATFQCGDIFAGHQHLDNNAFTIFHRRPLAIDSGVNEYSSHRANYYARSIAHNTILVFDPKEEFPSAVWSSRGSGGSNDGGQRRIAYPTRVTASAKEKAVRDAGSIQHYESQESFCYVVGDASRSYGATKVRHFLRHFVHLRPNYLVIYDEVETTKPALRPTWLLHSIEKPRLVDNSGTYVNPGGLLTSRLLPKAAEVEVVGGPAREYLVGGKNYPPNEKKDPEAGSWRIEVRAASGGKQRFLHVLRSFDPSTKARPGMPRLTLQSPSTRPILKIEGVAVVDFGQRRVRPRR